MASVPNLEYATEANPPTCKVLPVRRYEAEAVPWTSNVVEGAVVKIPTRLFNASIDKVLVSKEKPLTPPVRVRLVSLAKVKASALKVTVSPVASPKVVLPLTLKSVPVVMEPVA